MSTLNGIGTTLYGFSDVEEDGTCTATTWFTFLYLPIVPLGKIQLIRAITEPTEFKYRRISDQSLRMKEVLKTYLFGWIIFPLCAAWPFILFLAADHIGVPHFKFQGIAKGRYGLYEILVGFGIVYLFIFLWKWKDWEETRGLPKDYKERLKEKNEKE